MSSLGEEVKDWLVAIAVAVVLDGGEQIPTTGTGGSVAGPIAASVIDAAVDQ